jgi:hypothetical protein
VQHHGSRGQYAGKSEATDRGFLDPRPQARKAKVLGETRDQEFTFNTFS